MSLSLSMEFMTFFLSIAPGGLIADRVRLVELQTAGGFGTDGISRLTVLAAPLSSQGDLTFSFQKAAE